MSDNRRPKDADTICSDCAKAHGAIWPKGHYATWWVGICDVCGKQPPNGHGVCAVTDWKWDDKSEEVWP